MSLLKFYLLELLYFYGKFEDESVVSSITVPRMFVCLSL